MRFRVTCLWCTWRGEGNGLPSTTCCSIRCRAESAQSRLIRSRKGAWVFSLLLLLFPLCTNDISRSQACIVPGLCLPPLPIIPLLNYRRCSAPALLLPLILTDLGEPCSLPLAHTHTDTCTNAHNITTSRALCFVNTFFSFLTPGGTNTFSITAVH